MVVPPLSEAIAQSEKAHAGVPYSDIVSSSSSSIFSSFSSSLTTKMALCVVAVLLCLMILVTVYCVRVHRDKREGRRHNSFLDETLCDATYSVLDSTRDGPAGLVKATVRGGLRLWRCGGRRDDSDDTIQDVGVLEAYPAVVEDLDLIDEEDQVTHMMTLEDAVDPESGLSTAADQARQAEKMDIIDNSEQALVAFRREIYLTIQSSLDFQEAAHKILKMGIKPQLESELCNMLVDCCAQQRTYDRMYGMLIERFCRLKKEFQVVWFGAVAMEAANVAEAARKDLNEGKITNTVHASTKTVGSWTGAVYGASTGAALFSFIPGVGTLVGGIENGMIGAYTGTVAGEIAADVVVGRT